MVALLLHLERLARVVRVAQLEMQHQARLVGQTVRVVTRKVLGLLERRAREQRPLR